MHVAQCKERPVCSLISTLSHVASLPLPTALPKHTPSTTPCYFCELRSGAEHLSLLNLIESQATLPRHRSIALHASFYVVQGSTNRSGQALSPTAGSVAPRRLAVLAMSMRQSRAGVLKRAQKSPPGLEILQQVGQMLARARFLTSCRTRLNDASQKIEQRICNH